MNETPVAPLAHDMLLVRARASLDRVPRLSRAEQLLERARLPRHSWTVLAATLATACSAPGRPATLELSGFVEAGDGVHDEGWIELEDGPVSIYEFVQSVVRTNVGVWHLVMRVSVAGRRRFLTATLASIACGCVHATSRPSTLVAGTAPDPALPDRFELVCWNLHKNTEATAALHALAPEAHLALLQESVATPRAPAGHATLVVAFRRTRDDRPAGVMTVSRATPSSSTALLSDTHEPLSRTPKSTLVSMIPLARGGELLVANVHGVNFRRSDALRGQLQELDPLLRAHPGPTIVAGDFNTWSRDRRDVLSQFAQRHALASVFDGADAPRLDAVFYRGLRVKHSRVIPSKHSDHDALRVRFVVEDRAATTPRSPE